MSWNHRIVLHKAGRLENNHNIKWKEYLAIHEVHYDENGNAEHITKEPIDIVGSEGKDSLASIKWTLEEMFKSLQKPILNYNTLQEVNKETQNDFSKSIETKE